MTLVYFCTLRPLVPSYANHLPLPVAAMELILEDRPVGLAPLQDSPPLCLECFRQVTSPPPPIDP